MSDFAAVRSAVHNATAVQLRHKSAQKTGTEAAFMPYVGTIVGTESLRVAHHHTHGQETMWFLVYSLVVYFVCGDCYSGIYTPRGKT